jgi:type I restriction enzyme S subunit
MREGWKVKTIKDVTNIVAGGTPKTTVKDYWEGDIAWITPADMGKLETREVGSTRRTITELGLEKSSAKLFPENSVILSSRAPIGHLAINTIPMSTNQGCRGIVPLETLDTHYLFYFLKGNVTLLNELGTGTTFKELSTKALGSVSIPLPPLPEQRQIVAILDQAFAAIDQAKANIEKNIQNTKELFLSKLNEIFSQKGEGWEERSFQELSTRIGDGLHGTPNYDENGQYYFINGNNLSDGYIEIKENTKRVNKEEFEKHQRILTENTVLISINGTLGNVAFYNDEPVILGKSACYINFDSRVEKRYVKFLVQSSLFFENMANESTGATIKNFSLKSMRNYKLFLPPLEKQVETVNELELFDSGIKELSTTYSNKIASLEELKKSILQKAFAGELTGKVAKAYGTESDALAMAAEGNEEYGK